MKNRYLKLFQASVFGVLVLVGLYISSLYSHLLFRTLTEIISLTVAAMVVFIIFISWKRIKNYYWSIIGVAYLFIVSFNILRILAYSGIQVFNSIEGQSSHILIVFSKYGILVVLVLTLIPALKNRRNLDKKIFKYLLCSYILYSVSTLLWTVSEDKYSFLLFLEQSLNILSLCFMLKSVVEALVNGPYADALNELRLKEIKLQEMSLIDEETGVFNRRAALDTLERMIKLLKRSKQDLSICYIGLDNLSEIVDRYGEKEGNKMVNTMVCALKESIRQTDYICRLYDDEFLLILPGCGADKVYIIVERVRDYLANLNIEKKPYSIGFSYGFACYNYKNTFDIESFLRMADLNMYQDKIMKKEVAVTTMY